MAIISREKFIDITNQAYLNPRGVRIKFPTLEEAGEFRQALYYHRRAWRKKGMDGATPQACFVASIDKDFPYYLTITMAKNVEDVKLEIVPEIASEETLRIKMMNIALPACYGHRPTAEETVERWISQGFTLKQAERDLDGLL
jgi:hypothetical protein